MRSWLKSGSGRKTYDHPDLPLSPKPRQPSTPSPRPQTSNVNRSSTVSERFSSAYAGDRRSIAVEPGFEPSLPYSSDDYTHAPSRLGRSQTVARREAPYRNSAYDPQPSPLWSSESGTLPSFTEQVEPYHEYNDNHVEFQESMSAYQSAQAGRISSDTGHNVNVDRWTQRQLQRLNTEQGFRKQREAVQEPIGQSESLQDEAAYTSTNTISEPQRSQSQVSSQVRSQPHHLAYQGERTVLASTANAGQAQSFNTSSRPTNYSRQESYPSHSQHQHQHHQQQYAAPTSPQSQYSSDETYRPALTQSRSYNQQLDPQTEDTSMSFAGNGNGSLGSKQARTLVQNRQSLHQGISSRDGSGQAISSQGVPAFSTTILPTVNVGQPYQSGIAQQHPDVDRKTPQPMQTSEDMSPDEINQLIKEHKELREKYTKVKKYYFEKEDQVKQLQNSLAHQRLSQSRTSLDDTEYATRFNRLDGLVAQLAFSIRKSWRSMPSWLAHSVNKDAVATGKQEMTAAGRAFISCWLVEEVFDKYFHPDLDPKLSTQLRSIQGSLRRNAPPTQTTEEEESLTAKVMNWRLATLEGLQDALRSSQCPIYRAQLTDVLKDGLIAALTMHLHDPPPSDLEGGVHMIIELVVSIAIHLPVESRDVIIEYYPPGYSILADQMKLETGIPALTTSIADEAADRTSIKSTGSDGTDTLDSSNTSLGASGEQVSRKKSMLSALTGGKTKNNGSSDQQQRKHVGAGNSSGSLHRPDSSQGMRQDSQVQQPARVRMTAGIGVQIRGRSVLVKAPVFATS